MKAILKLTIVKKNDINNDDNDSHLLIKIIFVIVVKNKSSYFEAASGTYDMSLSGDLITMPRQ